VPRGCVVAHRRLEAEVRQARRQPQGRRQVLVGLLLPAAAPDQLKVSLQTFDQASNARRQEMRDSIDEQELPGRRAGWIEAEQGDDAVDVDQKNW
jgi:hypothetical protein